MNRLHRNKFPVAWSIGACLAVGASPLAVHAGPNLMAIGTYSEVPFQRAEGRDSFNGKEVVYSFDDPEFDFGRMVVRSTQPLSVVRRDLFVGYTGGALLIDTRGFAGGPGVQVDDVEVWLRIRGRIEPGKTYEWEFEGGPVEQDMQGIPAVIPAFWADGKQFGVEVTITDPYTIVEEGDQPVEDEVISRLLFPHGIVTIPAFENMTGCSWVVLKLGGNFGNAFALVRFTFREVEKDLTTAMKSAMPVPVRYIPIRSVLDDEIAAILPRSVETLKQGQNPDYYWNVNNDLESSVATTSIVVAALSETDASAEGLTQAMDWLAKQEPPPGRSWRTSTIANRLFCLARFGGLADYRSAINNDVQTLVKRQLDDGGWANVQPEGGQPGVTGGGAPVNPDNATSAGVLWALREARFAGAPVDARVWRKALQYWTDARAFDGGFREKLERYGGVGQATTSGYTALGAASLIMALDMAAGFEGKKCNAFLSNREQLRGINNAIAWLDKNYKERFKDLGSFTSFNDPFLEGEAFQLLGATSGIAFFNDKNHFDESAQALLAGADRGSGMFGVRNPYDGQWIEPPNFNRTASAVLILGGGSAPIVAQRIIVGDTEDRWGEYNFDVPHLVRYLSRTRERIFNWRRTTIDREVRELVEVPLLIVTVAGPVNWTPKEWSMIRDYCMAGGTVVFNINEDQSSQAEVVAAGLKQTFPEYQLAELPADHTLYSLDKKLADRPKLRAMSNGFRHFAFLPQDSWSCRWHLYEKGDKDESLAFMNNLVSYCRDGVPLRSAFIDSTYPTGSVPNRFMKAARIEVGGNVPAYPDLIEYTNLLMRTNFRLALERVDDPASADVLWVSVTGSGPPSESARNQILEAIKNGRYLLIDVVSGQKDWDEGFQAALKSLAPGITLEKLRRTSPVYTGEVPGTQGFDVVSTAFRKALHTRLTTRGRADLYGIRFNGKEVGVYSAHDLSSGVAYHYFPDCRGPMPEGARGLVMNALLEAYYRKVAKNLAS